MKIYFEQDGVKYYDYDLYLDDYDFNGIAVDYGTDLLLREGIDSLLTPITAIPVNSIIYVAPDCPTPIDDIRKNYTIKRQPDAGNYNVFHPYRKLIGGRTLKQWAIVPSEKKVFGIVDSWRGSKTTLTTMLAAYLPNMDVSGIPRYSGSLGLNILPEKAEPWLKLLRGEYVKPCVSYKSLQFAHTNELTMDIIDLLYRTGSVQSYNYSLEDLDKFVLQIKALNQCNWREYPRALSILFTEILEGRNICQRVISTVSSMPKPVKEILGHGFPDHSTSEKDFNMAKSVLDHFLGVENVRFTDAATLIDRLNKMHISLKTFSEFYGNIIKLTPKQYEE